MFTCASLGSGVRWPWASRTRSLSIVTGSCTIEWRTSPRGGLSPTRADGPHDLSNYLHGELQGSYPALAAIGDTVTRPMLFSRCWAVIEWPAVSVWNFNRMGPPGRRRATRPSRGWYKTLISCSRVQCHCRDLPQPSLCQSDQKIGCWESVQRAYRMD